MGNFYFKINYFRLMAEFIKEIGKMGNKMVMVFTSVRMVFQDKDIGKMEKE